MKKIDNKKNIGKLLYRKWKCIFFFILLFKDFLFLQFDSYAIFIINIYSFYTKQNILYYKMIIGKWYILNEMLSSKLWHTLAFIVQVKYQEKIFIKMIFIRGQIEWKKKIFIHSIWASIWSVVCCDKSVDEKNL